MDVTLDAAFLLALAALFGATLPSIIKGFEARYQASRGKKDDANKVVVHNQELADKADERELQSIREAAEMLKDWAARLLAAYNAEVLRREDSDRRREDSDRRREVSDILVANLRQEIVALRWQVTELTSQLSRLTGVPISPMASVPPAIEPMPILRAAMGDRPKSVEATLADAVGPTPDVSALVDKITNSAAKS